MKRDYFYQQIIQDTLTQKSAEDPSFSLRAYAGYLDIDAGALSKILSGKKLLTPALADKILAKLNLDTREKRKFLFSMANAYQAKGRKRKDPIINKLIRKQDHSLTLGHDIEADVYSKISEWYFYAIIQLVDSIHFQNDPKWIANQLNISEEQAEDAVSKLIEFNLLKEDQGKLVNTYEKVNSGDQYYTNNLFRKRIKQITEKSLDALENTPINHRSHNTMTIAIDPRKIDIAKVMIREFLAELGDVMGTKKEKVYEMQFSMFPLQRLD